MTKGLFNRCSLTLAGSIAALTLGVAAGPALAQAPANSNVNPTICSTSQVCPTGTDNQLVSLSDTNGWRNPRMRG